MSDTVMCLHMVAAGCAALTAVLYFLDRHMNHKSRDKS